MVDDKLSTDFILDKDEWLSTRNKHGIFEKIKSKKYKSSAKATIPFTRKHIPFTGHNSAKQLTHQTQLSFYFQPVLKGADKCSDLKRSKSTAFRRSMTAVKANCRGIAERKKLRVELVEVTNEVVRKRPDIADDVQENSDNYSESENHISHNSHTRVLTNDGTVRGSISSTFHCDNRRANEDENCNFHRCEINSTPTVCLTSADSSSLPDVVKDSQIHRHLKCLRDVGNLPSTFPAEIDRALDDSYVPFVDDEHKTYNSYTSFDDDEHRPVYSYTPLDDAQHMPDNSYSPFDDDEHGPGNSYTPFVDDEHGPDKSYTPFDDDDDDEHGPDNSYTLFDDDEHRTYNNYSSFGDNKLRLSNNLHRSTSGLESEFNVNIEFDSQQLLEHSDRFVNTDKDRRISHERCDDEIGKYDCDSFEFSNSDTEHPRDGDYCRNLSAEGSCSLSVADIDRSQSLQKEHDRFNSQDSELSLCSAALSENVRAIYKMQIAQRRTYQMMS